MLSLLRLQEEFASAVLSGDTSRIASEFVAGAGDPVRRFNIFRNNSYATLTSCLKAVFAVSMQLSDERFFDYAAHEFIKTHPPRDARLNAYGAEFPGFLAGFAPCRDFPILVDIATLEWAIAEASIACELPSLSMAQFAEIDQDGDQSGFALQPSLRFAVTRWPLLGVWAGHKNNTFVLNGPLEKKSSRVVVRRRGDGVQFFELEPARFSFWRSLARGRSIESSAKCALMRDPLFDLLKEIVFLSRQQLVTGILNTPMVEIDNDEH